jgi:hypothetical protein
VLIFSELLWREVRLVGMIVLSYKMRACRENLGGDEVALVGIDEMLAGLLLVQDRWSWTMRSYCGAMYSLCSRFCAVFSPKHPMAWLETSTPGHKYLRGPIGTKESHQILRIARSQPEVLSWRLLLAVSQSPAFDSKL